LHAELFKHFIFHNKYQNQSMEKYAQIKQLVTEAEGDFKAFYEKGNKAAGTRVRGVMQQLKGLAQEIRAEVTEKKGETK